MARKRQVGYSEGMMDEYPTIFGERNEVMKLTKMAKAWEFTCSFCFKKFPSAQAMGGHQNAHRHERMEERRLFIRDPIGYRKRAYIRAMKGPKLHAPAAAVPPPQMLKFNFLAINGPPKILHTPLPARVVQFNAPANIINSNRNYFFQPLNINGGSRNLVPAVVVMSCFPPKEVRIVAGAGSGAGGRVVKGKGRVEMEAGGGCGLMEMEKKLDLTLRLN